MCLLLKSLYDYFNLYHLHTICMNSIIIGTQMTFPELVNVLMYFLLLGRGGGTVLMKDLIQALQYDNLLGVLPVLACVYGLCSFQAWGEGLKLQCLNGNFCVLFLF